MSGFCRTIKTNIMPSNKISSGIISLDMLISLEPGTITAIYEDENSFFHQTILQIFASQTLFSNLKSSVRILGKEKKILTYFKKQKNLDNNENMDKIIIAWRYSHLKRKSNVFDWDLSLKSPIPPENLIYDFDELLELMKLNKDMIFIIFSIFSPLYEKLDITRFLFIIKKYCKLNRHIVFLSIPRFLLSEKTLPQLFFDNIFSINVDLKILLEERMYPYILTIRKVSCFGKLHENNLNSYKYGVKVSSKKIIIEEIEIPPDDTENPLPCQNNF